MQTWLPNSKKCSKPKSLLRGVPIFLLLIYSIIFSNFSYAVSSPPQIYPKIPHLQLISLLKSDLKALQSSSFNRLLLQWEKKYGVQAFRPLLEIASDRTDEDSHRYIALMGAAKLGGFTTARAFIPFLKESSWMLRAAALRTVASLGNPESGPSVIPLLRDPALVVRAEAIEAIKKLQPSGSSQAILETLNDPANYHAGKALWVPQKALSALVALQVKSAAPQLKPLLRHEKDPDLQLRTVQALESLTGKHLEPGAPLSSRVRAWLKASI